MTISGVEITVGILWIIPLIFELFIFALSIAFLLGALYVKFRDINYIWEVILQAGFYATPIIYPISMVISISPMAAKIMLLSPVAQTIQDIRYFVITPETITISSLYSNTAMHLIPIGMVAIVTAVGVLYFKKRAPSFAEEV
jgi:ABC-2 type transport system permease protein